MNYHPTLFDLLMSLFRKSNTTKSKGKQLTHNPRISKTITPLDNNPRDHNSLANHHSDTLKELLGYKRTNNTHIRND